MLDLSKLAALELPKKEIEVIILGEKQTLSIQALDDEAAVRISVLAASEAIPEDERELKIRRIILGGGAPDLSEGQIDLIMKRSAAAAANIMSAIRDLTNEYVAARNLIREQAEKNFEAAAGANAKG